MAGPATPGRAAGVKLNWRATPGVTPTVAAVGATGDWNCARAWVNCCGDKGRAAAATGLDCAITAAGTTVAPPRLMKFCTTVWLFIPPCTFVWLITCVTLRTLVTFTERT
jgi:hypothetical protein